MWSSAPFALAAKQGDVARQERQEAAAARRIPIAVTTKHHRRVNTADRRPEQTAHRSVWIRRKVAASRIAYL